MFFLFKNFKCRNILAWLQALIFFFLIPAPAAEAEVVKITYKVSVKTSNPFFKLGAAIFFLLHGDYKKIEWEEKIFAASSDTKRIITIRNKTRSLMELFSDTSEESILDIRGNGGEDAKIIGENISTIFRLLDFVAAAENIIKGARETFNYYEKKIEDDKIIHLKVESVSRELKVIAGKAYKKDELSAEFKIFVALNGLKKGNVVRAEFKYGFWPTLVLDSVYFHKDGLEVHEEQEGTTDDFKDFNSSLNNYSSGFPWEPPRKDLS